MVYLQGLDGAEGVGSDCLAHLSAARGGPAGHAFYPAGRQSTRGSTVCQEVETAIWRRARTVDVRSRVLRRPRTAGIGAAGFVRCDRVADGHQSELRTG